MPWWSWVLIWMGLVALLICVLVLGAAWLLRKSHAIFTEVHRLELVEAEARQLAEEVMSARERASITQRRPVAFGRSGLAVREYHAAQRAAHAERVAARRERRLTRGRTITRADPWQYAHLLNTPKKG